MAEFDADFVEVRPAEYVDGRGSQHRGTRLARALCCGLEFAIIPPSRFVPDGYTEVEPVRVQSGEVVRRIAILRSRPKDNA